MSTYDARQKRYYKKHREKIKKRCRDYAAQRFPDFIYRRLGLLPADYAKLLERSGNLCEICGEPPGKRRLCVDHDHTTHEVRGLLCNMCNWLLNEKALTPGWFAKAAAYLAQPGIKTMRSLLQQSAVKSLQDEP